MIRQAISCDICGTEKKQTNHWFVAYEQGGELRVSGWNTRNRLRPGSKHLCGQTCLHKLVDDFMARALTARVRARPSLNEVEEELMEQAVIADTSLTSDAAYKEFESSARLIPTPKTTARPAVAPAAAASTPAAPARPTLLMPIELVASPARPRGEEAVVHSTGATIRLAQLACSCLGARTGARVALRRAPSRPAVRRRFRSS